MSDTMSVSFQQQKCWPISEGGTADRLCDRQVGRFATASLVRLTEMVG
jgi:hypothetical protein